jgi:hypothetical protein
LHPPLFQRLEVPPHARWIIHAPKQAMRIYIIQKSVRTGAKVRLVTGTYGGEP